MAPPPPVAHLHQSPSQQSPTTFLTPSNVPSSSAPATYSPVDDDGSNALEDLFFDRFNGVNEQVDTLETQLADFVRMLSMSSAAGAAASRIQVTRQNLQVMYDEREQALAKVVVHSPLLLQRTSALLAANLQNMPELWARAYQKLKLMATHLKSAQDNLVTLQFHVTELESLDKSPSDKLCTLQQTIQNTHQYVANLRRNRQDECVALVSFSAPLRVRVADELNEQRRKGLLS
ncbi:hypothetical protein B5M09_010724 [Aphanomyces astaci]|nr:hypothetical protein B5M09_010724 [Aphanomyces astaci]